MDGRRLRALLDDAARRWPRLGLRARVFAACALVATGLAAPDVLGGSFGGRASEAAAVVTEAEPLLLAPGVPAVAAPVPTVTATTATATTVAPVPPVTAPWVVEVDPATTTTQLGLPPGAFLTKAQAQDLIRSKFPRSEWDNALAVADCESHFQALAVNVNTDGSRDFGLFQINDGGTLQYLGGTEALAFDPVWNVDAAYRLWRSFGWVRWTCAYRVGILDPDLTSTTDTSTTTTPSAPAPRASTSTTFNWPLGNSTTPTSSPPTTGAPTTAVPATAAPATAAPTTAPPTTAAASTSATTPTSGTPTS